MYLYYFWMTYFVEFTKFHIYINKCPMRFAKFSCTKTDFVSFEHLFCPRHHLKS